MQSISVDPVLALWSGDNQIMKTGVKFAPVFLSEKKIFLFMYHNIYSRI